MSVPPFAVALIRTVVAMDTGNVGRERVPPMLPAGTVRVVGKEVSAEPPFTVPGVTVSELRAFLVTVNDAVLAVPFAVADT